MDVDELSDDPSDFHEYDDYGRTPPRTKILRKSKEKKQRIREVCIGNSASKTQERKKSLKMSDDVKSDYDSDSGGKKSNKRNLKLLRVSERDLKLDIESAQLHSSTEEKMKTEYSPLPKFQIESCKRFRSLSCRTIPCLKKIIKKIESIHEVQHKVEDCPNDRLAFYKQVTHLFKSGCEEDQDNHDDISHEEYLWQNEFKDLIWLELQAFHADRTPIEEDNYLCQARENVDSLLNYIINYKFRRHSKNYSTQNSDSGVEDDCEGCLSMYCHSCIEAQNEALKDIENLMKKLEAAEALFPSSKAFAELYPLYNSPEFVGRVKAVSLWYNMTKHQRLKLLILGKLMALLENKDCLWPLPNECDSSNSSDSNRSTNSMSDYISESKNCEDFYNINPIAMLVNKKCGNVSPYRKYIENILKTRTLNKSLHFLDRLHTFVLRKAQLTLQPPDETIFSKYTVESEDEELQRYGSWSPEAQALNLPSYRASFLFLAAIPLEVIHEFLKMRLEQKPANPSPLSIRQLMRELKEGLKVATVQKEKTITYVESAIIGTKSSLDMCQEKFKEFDKCMLSVFNDYLDYLEQWALIQTGIFQKNLLEEEWEFACEVSKSIPGSFELLAKKYSIILSKILKSIGQSMIERIEDIIKNIPEEDGNLIKQMLFTVCRELQSLFKEKREMCIKTVAFCRVVFKNELPDDAKICLMYSIISLKCQIPQAIECAQVIFKYTNYDCFDEIEKASMVSRIREILIQGYRFGFEFYKAMSESIPSDTHEKLSRSMIQFAHLWIKFATDKFERGHGMKPRWSYQGFEFLLAICDPRHTKYLTPAEFEELKSSMECCISHVIGSTMTPTSVTPDSGFNSNSPRWNSFRSRSRGSSPKPTYRSQRSSVVRKISLEQTSPSVSQPDGSIVDAFSNLTMRQPPNEHSELYVGAIERLENDRNKKLMDDGLIGKVLSSHAHYDKRSHYKRKLVTFTWQRGIKIGQGRFGKVYTAVNNNTGEMMAVKEITLQPNDTLTIRRVAEEMKILEGINHQNLVKYYGVEVHKEEMLIFMEYCAEGTLEHLVAASEHGLSELLVRRYTFQLVAGVAVLHEHGVVHRDIKTANIFLTDSGNCLKIGDFGCAAKIKSHTTMPGELQGFVGTQAYMAPEIFTKNTNEGHGRAADIWSIGCVVVEMASGKRPWAQYDNNYQIMFKVGMGQSPDPPDDMFDEGLDFLEMCFQHDPKDRATARELLDHNFVKVGDDFN